MNTFPHESFITNGARRSAFSLIELLAVLAIMITLMSLAVPVYSLSGGATQFRFDVGQLDTQLQNAREYAMAHRTFVRAIFSEDSGEGGMLVVFIANPQRRHFESDTSNMSDALKWPLIQRPNRLRLALANEAADNGPGRDSPYDSRLGEFHRQIQERNIQTSAIIEFGPNGEASVMPDEASRFIGVPLTTTTGNESAESPGDAKAVIWINAASGRIWTENLDDSRS